MEQNEKVAICLVTYNQEKYIAQAIESVLMQQVKFGYTIFLGDDCSTDTTQKIIYGYKTKYPDKIEYLCTEQNQGVVGNTLNVFRHIFANAEYKYVAMLDGDDFWTAPCKLQKQVDFLESHPDFAFVFARMGTCLADGSKYFASVPRHIGEGGDWFNNLMHIAVPNGTVMHRRQMLETIDWDKILSWNLLSFDYPTNAFMASQGKVGFIDDEMGVWRRGGETVSSSKQIEKILLFIDYECRQSLYLAKEFPNTAYAGFTEEDAEKHRSWQIVENAKSEKSSEWLQYVDWNIINGGKNLGGHKIGSFFGCILFLLRNSER